MIYVLASVKRLNFGCSFRSLNTKPGLKAYRVLYLSLEDCVLNMDLHYLTYKHRL